MAGRDKGPEKFLWERTLHKARVPRPAFTWVALDRDQCRAACVNQRTIHIVTLPLDPQKGPGQQTHRVVQAPRDMAPSASCFTACAWCMSREWAGYVAAVLGSDIFVFNADGDSAPLVLPAPCGRAVARSTPLIDWGGNPAVLITAGRDTDRRGLVLGWSTDLPADSRAGSARESWRFSIASDEGGPHELAMTPSWRWGGSGRRLLAIRSSSVVQVWVVPDTRPAAIVWDHDLCKSPPLSLCWCSDSQKLLVLVRAADRGGASTGVVEVDVDAQEMVEPERRREARGDVTSARVFALPFPFSSSVLVAATSSQKPVDLVIRGTGADSSSELLPALDPPNPVAVALRSLDSSGDGTRSLQLVALYGSGRLAAIELFCRPVDFVVDQQLGQVQSTHSNTTLLRREPNMLLFCVTVPGTQVAYLDQTHYRSESPPRVFFNVRVLLRRETGAGSSAMPELHIDGGCARLDHEMSLEQTVLDAMLSKMRRAVSAALQEGGPWLVAALGSCNAYLSSLGQLQPSQLRSAPRRGARTGRPFGGSTSPGSTLSPDTDRRWHAGETPPPRRGGTGLSPGSQAELGAVRARPHRFGSCLSEGSLLHFGPSARTVRVFHLPWTETAEWELGGGAPACQRNAAAATAGEDQKLWTCVAAFAAVPYGSEHLVTSAVEALLRPLLPQRPLLLAAACCHLARAPTKTASAADCCLLPESMWPAAYASLRMLVEYLAKGGGAARRAEAVRSCGAFAALIDVPNPSVSGSFELGMSADGEPPQSLWCAVCASVIRGPACVCTTCGHALHVTCHRRWFQVCGVQPEAREPDGNSPGVGSPDQGIAASGSTAATRPLGSEPQSLGHSPDPAVPLCGLGSPAAAGEADAPLVAPQSLWPCPTGCGCLCCHGMHGVG